MEEFTKIGERIEKIWRDKNYSEVSFPDIAAEALEEAELPKKFSAFDVMKWALRTSSLPEQKDLRGRFGDPPITIYNSLRFHVDVYFWLEGTTTIHQHAFCGAFQVFHGSSLHSIYDFEVEEPINFFTELGKVNFQKCELLKVGDIRKILPGREFIHALFHLDQPSATIVIRTHRSPLHLPQFDYRKPCLAIDPFFEEPNMIKKFQTVSSILRLNLAEADDLISEIIENSDFQTTFLLLSFVKDHLDNNKMNRIFSLQNSQQRFNKFLEVAVKRHGNRANVLPSIFHNQHRILEIVRRRSYITNSEHRFFLALLMNLEGKKNILKLVEARFPQFDPIEKVLDWIDELSRTKVFDGSLQNALGIDDFDHFDLIALESHLKNFTTEQEREFLKHSCDVEPTEEILKKVTERKKKLSQAVVLEPLFL
ncbi:MAG: hypothetical protein D6687_11105 [Acidobacteria bacterium]|jgi:hypothetical protein|nr:MAG: hypothetical protein D6687_11105 [Acidobacteriota bacterium]GIU83033.1 MAG: hypothetical protein KatS3mg006_2097 [Pyrinomonadaceae bacterium]